MFQWWRCAVTLARIAGLLTVGYFKVRFVCPALPPRRSEAVVRDWCRQVLDTLGVKWSVSGRPFTGDDGAGVLVVANHVSWVDTIAIRAWMPCGFLAKKSLSGWPVIGPLIGGTGGVFVQRGNPFDLQRALDDMRRALANGRSICVFPEGTTTDGTSVGPFATLVFELAARPDVTLLPVGLRYLQNGLPTSLPAWIGDEAFLPSLVRIAMARGLEVQLVAGEPLPRTDDRQVAAASARHTISALARVPLSLDLLPTSPSVKVSPSAQGGRASDIAASVRRWIAEERKLPSREIADHASLRSLGIDSLSILRMIVELEQHLALRVDESKLDLSSQATVLELSAAVASAEH